MKKSLCAVGEIPYDILSVTPACNFKVAEIFGWSYFIYCVLFHSISYFIKIDAIQYYLNSFF